jgi:hypothetical protein
MWSGKKMANDLNLTVEQPVEQKSCYVSPEVFDYGDAASLTKTLNTGPALDGSSTTSAYTS